MKEKIPLVNNIEQSNMINIIFSQYVKLKKESDLGDWLYFYKDGKICLIKIVDCISDIEIKKYQLLFEKFQVIFVEKDNLRMYVFEDGFLKRNVNEIILENVNNQEKTFIYRTCQNGLKQGIEETFYKMVLLMAMSKYHPLQVKIMLIKENIYFIYAETKQANKNSQYSIPKELIIEDLNLIHFVLKEKAVGVAEDNILRTEIKYTKLNIKNDRYFINDCEYQKIQKKNKSN